MPPISFERGDFALQHILRSEITDKLVSSDEVMKHQRQKSGGIFQRLTTGLGYVINVSHESNPNCSIELVILYFLTPG